MGKHKVDPTEFLRGWSDAMWASAWSSWCDEGRPNANPRCPIDKQPCPGPGDEVLDVLPGKPKKLSLDALKASRGFLKENHQILQEVSRKPRPKGASKVTTPVAALVLLAAETDDVRPEEISVYDLGFSFAMESMGHGVSWFDDHGWFPVQYLFFEYHYMGNGETFFST